MPLSQYYTEKNLHKNKTKQLLENQGGSFVQFGYVFEICP